MSPLTYESDSGLAQSWIDFSQASSALISGIQAVHLGPILSDHFPLFSSLNVQPKTLPTSAGSTLGTPHHTHINWDKVNSSNIQNYCDMLSHSLLPLPASVSNCVSSCCMNHHADLDTWSQKGVGGQVHNKPHSCTRLHTCRQWGRCKLVVVGQHMGTQQIQASAIQQCMAI